MLNIHETRIRIGVVYSRLRYFEVYLYWSICPLGRAIWICQEGIQVFTNCSVSSMSHQLESSSGGLEIQLTVAVSGAAPVEMVCDALLVARWRIGKWFVNGLLNVVNGLLMGYDIHVWNHPETILKPSWKPWTTFRYLATDRFSRWRMLAWTSVTSPFFHPEKTINRWVP